MEDETREQEQEWSFTGMLRQRKWFFIAVGVMIAVILMPTPSGLSAEGKYMLALLVVVIICFFTEAIPLPAVALFIGVYQIVMGITEFKDLPATFMEDAVFFIMGALMIGAVLVRYGVHNRIALFILKLSGTKVQWVVAGIITTCALAAGFISEHAVATIMLPVGIGIVALSGGISKVPSLGKLLMLAIAYGCQIGGLASPSGGARNAIMIGFLSNPEMTGTTESLAPSYGKWMLMAMPFTLIMIPVTTFLLLKFFKPEVHDVREAVESIKSEMAAKGRVKFSEGLVIGIFLLTLALWITLSEKWGLGGIAIMIAVLFMIMGLSDWKFIEKRTQWGVVLLYGGAISMGAALGKTGAAAWIADIFLNQLDKIGVTAGMPLVGATSLLTVVSTNLMADGPAVALLGPIHLEMATLSQTSPLVVGITTSLSSAFAYMLIIGTPANAIVYGSGFLKSKDYLKAGWVMAVLSLFMVILVLAGFWWKLLGIW